MDKNLLGAACDLSLSLYNVEAMRVDYHFTNSHKGSVKSLAFSPLNKLLLCSVGVDRQICFYDMNEKVIVKKIKTETSLSKVAFCSDGHTIAIGSDQEDGLVLVYDLRKSS